MSVPPTFNQDQCLLIQQEVKELINKGEISEDLKPHTGVLFKPVSST